MSKRPKKYDTEQPRDALRLGGLKRVTTRALVVLGPIQEVHSDFPRFFALPSAAVYVLYTHTNQRQQNPDTDYEMIV